MKLLFTGILLLSTAWAQSPPDIQVVNAPATTKPLPTHLIYRHFLAWVNDLRTKADAAGVTDPHKFAEPFAEKAGLTDEQIDIVGAEAKSLSNDLKNQDQRMAALVAAYRREATAAVKSGDPLPTPPSGVREMQQERDTLIKSHVSILRGALGPKSSARLDRYLAKHISPHISLRPLTIPTSVDSAGPEIPPVR